MRAGHGHWHATEAESERLRERDGRERSHLWQQRDVEEIRRADQLHREGEARLTPLRFAPTSLDSCNGEANARERDQPVMFRS